ncbi:hypothetical protein PGT21_030039 [Puccinia graminis f. sp. tritici]|uniref:Uncharacterized protein n=1 Tax=Puccinia graminis f. sp. tritici TaxID=56615 RepID=A0A5B0M0B9_PUCGR|nr:hypothetical protein PGT21_030039 [Puccinia graminis f. sp. tritici]KAA1100459.1 hypothetical protein PGTUg99_006960 [Puccinia graminis f. sp. tritici]
MLEEVGSRIRARILSVLIGIKIGTGGPNASPWTGMRHQRPDALDCGRSFSSTSRDPNKHLTPERSETLLGPSQGALQVNQATQRLYDDGAVIQTSTAAQLRTARSKIKICM